MHTHIKVVAVLFIALGALGLLGAAFAGVTLGTLATIAGSSADEDALFGVAILGATGIALAAMLVILSIPSLWCGWGLLRFRRWARILAVVLAAFAVINFPVGTAFGAYVFWVMFQKQTEVLFSRAADLGPSGA